MPEPPEGEADLRQLAGRFELAESQIRELITEAALGGSRRSLLTEALRLLVALRGQDLRGPLVAAYLTAYQAAKRGGDSARADDLAASLAKRLDQGAKRAQAGSRRAFRSVTERNLNDLAHEAVTAHVDDRGARWTLSGWATMNTLTIGRQASSRGISDGIGEGGRVVVSVGQCKWCQSHAGEGVIGEIPLPPFHASCTCSASAA